MREEERTKDQTSSHGVAYGYTLTNAVGGRRPYDSNKGAAWLYLSGRSCTGQAICERESGKSESDHNVFLECNKHARYYDVYVYKAGESNPTQFQYGVNGTSWSCTLPAGNYGVAVASVNHAQYAYTFSDSVNFTVQAAPVTHTHNYQRVTVKGNPPLSTDIYRSSAAAGSIQNKQIIYYPKNTAFQNKLYL